MNIGAVSDEVSTIIPERAAPGSAEQGFGWLLDAIREGLEDLSDAAQARRALIEVAARGFLLLRFLCPDIDPGDLFLDFANAARRHSGYRPPADALVTPVLYARLLGYVSQALQQSADDNGGESRYETLADAVALAEVAVALYDERDA